MHFTFFYNKKEPSFVVVSSCYSCLLYCVQCLLLTRMVEGFPTRDGVHWDCLDFLLNFI